MYGRHIVYAKHRDLRQLDLHARHGQLHRWHDAPRVQQ